MVGLRMKNRRKGPDYVVKLISFFSFVTWMIFFITLIVFHMASPRMGSYHAVRVNYFDMGSAVVIIKVLLFINIIISVWGIIANTMRNKRKTDTFRSSLVASTLLSLVGFIIVVIKF
jgi:hypothetical protein